MEGRPKMVLSSSGSCIKDKIQIFSLPFSGRSCFDFFFLHFSQVNFSSSLDTGHGSGSGSGSTPGSAAGCQSPLPLVTLSPIIHPRIREFRSGLGSTRKGGPSSPCSTKGATWVCVAAVLSASFFHRRASFSVVSSWPLQLPSSWQR